MKGTIIAGRINLIIITLLKFVKHKHSHSTTNPEPLINSSLRHVSVFESFSFLHLMCFHLTLLYLASQNFYADNVI